MRSGSAELPQACYFKERRHVGQMVLGRNDSGAAAFSTGYSAVLHSPSSKMKGTSSLVSKPTPRAFATSENIGAPTTSWNIMSSYCKCQPASLVLWKQLGIRSFTQDIWEKLSRVLATLDTNHTQHKTGNPSQSTTASHVEWHCPH